MTADVKCMTVSGLNKLRHAIGFHQIKASGRTKRKFTATRAHYNATVPDADMEQAKGCGLVTMHKTNDGTYQYVLTQAGIGFLSEVLECEITCTYARE